MKENIWQKKIRKIHRLREIMYSNKEKKKVIDILYKYKEAFSLRDEIGTCPNREVEIDMTDKPPFFIRPYHVKKRIRPLYTWKWNNYAIKEY